MSATVRVPVVADVPTGSGSRVLLELGELVKAAHQLAALEKRVAALEKEAGRG